MEIFHRKSCSEIVIPIKPFLWKVAPFPSVIFSKHFENVLRSVLCTVAIQESIAHKTAPKNIFFISFRRKLSFLSTISRPTMPAKEVRTQ